MASKRAEDAQDQTVPGEEFDLAVVSTDRWLHKLCHEGDLNRIKQALTDKRTFEEELAKRKGVFGYTPLHEAVANGQHEVLAFLLDDTDLATDINCQANSGYTPLHLAASSGHIKCLRVLIEHGADITVTDEYGKTPKQTAALSGKNTALRIFRSIEIIKVVEMNGEGLTDLLRVSSDQLESDCLNRALLAAVRNDNHFNVGKLIVKGAANIAEALALSKELGKPNARAMLLMIKAAIEGDRNLVLRLFGDLPPQDDDSEFNDENFQEVQKLVRTGKVSTVVPIEIARRNDHPAVREELLFKTDVNEEEGLVYWHGLRLRTVEVSWLQKIQWVKKLRLARNGLKVLPEDMGLYLKQVMKLDLQHNELATIPRCILQLPALEELSLSHNKLTKIPAIPERSPNLTMLDLSYNCLSSLPKMNLPAIQSLSISHNDFHKVPIVICSLVTLHSLDLSDNPDILSLPPEMGNLSALTRLNLRGLKELNDPPRHLQRDCADCIRYLNSKRLSSHKK